MSNRFILACLMLFAIVISVTYSQDSVAASINKHFDLLLKDNSLKESDLSFPEIQYGPRFYRTNIQPRLLKNPKAVAETIEFYFSAFDNASNINVDQLSARIFEDVKLKKPKQIINFDNLLPVEQINKRLGINTDSVFGFLGGMVLRQYISPMLQMIDVLEKDYFYSDDKNVKQLVSQFDKVFSMPYSGKDALSSSMSYHAESGMLNDYSVKSSIFLRSDIMIYGMALHKAMLKINLNSTKIMQMLRDSLRTKSILTKFGRIAIGGSGDDTYTGDYLFIFDIGGNDTYNFSNVETGTSWMGLVKALVDYEGNDKYSAGDKGLASGTFGTSLLYDLNGNDTYKAGDFSLGTGFFGVGILFDQTGDDTYIGGRYSMGAGTFGIGILYDKSGNDKYISTSFSQGFGGTAGAGYLYDGGGNDAYTSNGENIYMPGMQSGTYSISQGAAIGFPWISCAGMGMMIDKSGNDIYKAASFSQAASMGGGTAILADMGGNDIYNGDYYCQGSAINQSYSMLFDKMGNDEYNAKGICQAAAYDYSFAGLFDLAGKDTFSTAMGSKSFAKQNSIAAFGDMTHNNNILSRYAADGALYRTIEQDFFSLMIQPDTARLTEASAFRFVDHPHKSSYRNFKDFDEKLKKEIQSAIKERLSKNQTEKLPGNFDSLYAYSLIINPVKQSGMYAGAILKLADMAKKDLKLITNHLKSNEPDELAMLQDVIKRIGETDTTAIVKLLADSLSSSNFSLISIAYNLLPHDIIDKDQNTLQRWYNSKDWRLRIMYARLFDEDMIKIQGAKLYELANDKNYFVRAAASYNIAKYIDDEDLSRLFILVNDESNYVRTMAYKGLDKNNSLDGNFMKQIFKEDWPIEIRIKMLPYIVKIEVGKKYFGSIKPLILKSDQLFRAAIYGEIINSPESKWKDYLKELYKAEKDPQMKEMLKDYRK